MSTPKRIIICTASETDNLVQGCTAQLFVTDSSANEMLQEVNIIIQSMNVMQCLITNDYCSFVYTFVSPITVHTYLRNIHKSIQTLITSCATSEFMPAFHSFIHCFCMRR